MRIPIVLGIVLTLATVLCVHVTGNNELVLFKGSSCKQAQTEPVLGNESYCHPLVNLTNSYCKHYGIKLDEYVNVSKDWQPYWNFRLWQTQEQYNQVYSKMTNLSATPECFDQVRFIGCYYMFPGCDSTTGVFKLKSVCKKTCEDFSRDCESFVRSWKEVLDVGNPVMMALLDCSQKAIRNAGESPECIFYNKNETFQKDDCLYLNGSSYHGNISVTASGIPCQSWTEQCPHRHTMNTTYPELNHANNYCRNPQNSGKLPWCFTTERSKRWEYCDIPKCIPVDGGYGNWSLNSSCSVTCGEGVETWRRKCDNPKLKYSGRDCIHLGTAIEYRNCARKPCAVNGNYSSWFLSIPCNASCGEGRETWRRLCDNPTPRHGGRNCSLLGEDVKYQICKRQPCPIDGNYSAWTKSSACSVTCGVGHETWSRRCDNPPPKYGGDCIKYGADTDSRPCHMAPCPVSSSSKVIKVSLSVFASLVFIGICLLLIRKRNTFIKRFRRRDSYSPYAVLIFTMRDDVRSPEHTSSEVHTTEEKIYESIDDIILHESKDEVNRSERENR